MDLVKAIVLTCHIQGIFHGDNLPVDTPDDRHTSDGEEGNEPNPLRHVHLQFAEYDYRDREECKVQDDVSDVEGETILSDIDTCPWVNRGAIGLQTPAFHKGKALEHLEEDCRHDESKKSDQHGGVEDHPFPGSESCESAIEESN